MNRPLVEAWALPHIGEVDVMPPLTPKSTLSPESVQDVLKPELVAFWDRQAAGYDASPGHGMGTTDVQRAWRRELAALLGDARQGTAPKSRVLDIGTGTGFVALLAADLGHDVTAIDNSSGMLARGMSRAADLELSILFVEADAEDPPFNKGAFDVVLSRHVLWTLPNPDAAAARWVALVVPGGSVAVFDVYHPRLSLPRRALGVLAERLDAGTRRKAGEHKYTKQQRAALPLAVQRDPSAGEQVLIAAGLRDVLTRRLRDVDSVERAQLRLLERLGRPWLRYVATGRRVGGQGPPRHSAGAERSG